MEIKRLCLVSSILVMALSGCRPETNKNGFELGSYDVKERVSSVEDAEIREVEDYPTILGSGGTSSDNNNAAVEPSSEGTIDSSVSSGSAAGKWSIPALGFPYDKNEVACAKITQHQGPSHTGVDMIGVSGQGSKVNGPKIMSVTNGTVIHSATSTSAGNWVVVRSKDSSGNTFYVMYMHLANLSKLKAGDTVNTNTVIGIQGNTGQSFGAHLHLQVSTAASDAAALNPGSRTNHNPLVVLYGYKTQGSDALKTESGGQFR